LDVESWELEVDIGVNQRPSAAASVNPSEAFADFVFG
jgi:hypothetical protein